MRIEPILGVEQVRKSSKWYQDIFDLHSAHGGDNFEILQDSKGIVILCLHRWGEHEHPTIHKKVKHNGNGLILYIKVDNLEEVWQKALKAKANIEFEPELNENSGRQEFACRDLDGYYLLVST